MVRNRFPRGGNYPTSEGNPRDGLVQWAHGAGGMTVVLCKASEVTRSTPSFPSLKARIFVSQNL